MTSDDIKQLLAQKHTEDVFVSECKDGPSTTGRHVRLDGWAMERSWSHPRVIGYEIKVNRQDFVKDDKWQSYLSLCNQFFFVCPSGLIQPEEIPNGVGLLWVSKTGNTLVTKKKAEYRNVQIPESLFRYILMCRTRITKPNENSGQDWTREQELRKWVDRKEEKRSLSYLVKSKIKEVTDNLRRENDDLKRQNDRFHDIRDMLEKMGLDSRWVDGFGVNRQIEQKRMGVAKDVERLIKRLKNELENAEHELKRIDEKADKHGVLIDIKEGS